MSGFIPQASHEQEFQRLALKLDEGYNSAWAEDARRVFMTTPCLKFMCTINPRLLMDVQTKLFVTSSQNREIGMEDACPDVSLVIKKVLDIRRLCRQTRCKY